MQPKIRILFVTSGATAGGAERQLLLFLRHCNRALFAPSVLTVLAADSGLRRGGSDFRNELADINIPFRSLDLPRFPTIAGLLALLRTIRLERPSIVQTYGLAVDFGVRLIAPLIRGARLVGSIRGPEEQRNSLLFRLDGWTSWLLVGYISNSRVGAEAIMRRSRVRPERISIIANGLDESCLAGPRSLAARPELRAKWGIPQNHLVVLTVANIHAAKGHEDLVRAASLCPRPDLTFVLAGSDRSNGRIAALVEASCLKERFRFLGLCQEIPNVLAAADIFVLPSHWEGMSNALMEAMGSGLPCISTRVGAATELLDDGRAGVLVPPRDPESLARAVCCLADDEEERKRLGAAARDRIFRHCGMDRMISLYEAHYSQIFMGGPMPQMTAAGSGETMLSNR